MIVTKITFYESRNIIKLIIFKDNNSLLWLLSAQVLETVNPNVPSKFQDHIQIGNDTLILPQEIKGHRYQQEYHNSTHRSTNNFRGSLQILDSDHELENVVEIIEEGDEDITDLRRHATTPQSHPSQKDYFEKNQVG